MRHESATTHIRGVTAGGHQMGSYKSYDIGGASATRGASQHINSANVDTNRFGAGPITT